MLNLIQYGFGSVGEGEIAGKIKECVSSGRRAFLIVPEQQTLSAEAQYTAMLPPSYPRFFEVTNFTRLANTLFRQIGGGAGEYCSATSRSLVMWKALSEISPMLEMTRGRSNVSSGIVDKALGAIGEMQSLGITPEELDSVTEGNTVNARLAGKLHDISLIYSTYKRLLSEKYNDTSDVVLSLAKRLAENPEPLENHEIFLEGFTSFTYAQYKLLETLVRCANVTIGLQMHRFSNQMFEYGELVDTLNRLKKIADVASVPVKITRPTAISQDANSAIIRTSELLFGNDGELDGDVAPLTQDDIKIYEGDTPFEVCDFVCADIKRRVQSGAKYSDFAVIVRSINSYLGVIDDAMELAKIPYFTSTKQDITSYEAIRLISCVYKIIVSGFAKEDVISYAKCGLCGITRSEIDDVTLYIEKWNITGRGFTDGEVWNMNPRGYEKMREGDSERLVYLNGIRERLMAPVLSLYAKARGIHTVREHAELLVEFLTEIGLEQRLTQRAEELSRLGRTAQAEENSRLWKIICDSLDTLVEVLGEAEADAESFFAQLHVVFSGTSIARIPARRDEVTVGSADMLRVKNKKHVYLLGVNQGEFPSTVSDNSYFSEKDKLTLSQLGIRIEPDMHIKNARELYFFTRAFTVARDSVTLLYARRTCAYTPSLPHQLIKRICELSGGNVVAKKIEDVPLIDRLYYPEAAIERIGEADEGTIEALKESLRAFNFGEIVSISEKDIENSKLKLSNNAVGFIYDGGIYLSQSKLDAFQKCPMKYYLNYNLHLDENENAEVAPNVIGTFVHEILEKFFTRVHTNNINISDISTSERIELTREIANKYLRELLGEDASAPRTAVTMSRLMRASLPVVDSLCDELSKSEFKPQFFELKTDGKNPNLPDPMRLNMRDGTPITVSGFIDRVDTLKRGDDVYVRVVDYKTGQKEFSPSDIEEGKNLQMFIYLKSIVDSKSVGFRNAIGVGKSGVIIPAGVVYVKASLGDVKIDSYSEAAAWDALKQKQKREGMILDEPESYKAMNPEFLPVNPESEKLSAKDRARLFSREDWVRINETIETVILDFAEEMKSGNIRAIPSADMMSGCSLCKFKPFCRVAK